MTFIDVATDNTCERELARAGAEYDGPSQSNIRFYSHDPAVTDMTLGLQENLAAYLQRALSDVYETLGYLIFLHQEDLPPACTEALAAASAAALRFIARPPPHRFVDRS